MPSTTYVARRPGLSSALVQAPEIGGLRLEPHPPFPALDRFYDTDDGELLRRGLALRVREQRGTVTASLGTVEGVAGAAAEQDLAISPADARLDLPSGMLADTVRAAVGDDPLRLLFALRQYRTPRVAYEGRIPIGSVSFDVVMHDIAGGRVVSNEVEIEPAPGSDLADLLGPVFEAHGLEAAERTPFARGLLRVRRTLTEAALLLPDERRRLEEVVASAPDPSLRRRAHVVLLDSRGFRPDTIASQTGLSMARVQYWRERFRQDRLGLLDPEPPMPPQVQAPQPPAPLAQAPTLARPSEPRPATEGDGVALGDPALDMADFLDLFSSPLPDTPFLDGGPDDLEEAADPLDAAPEPLLDAPLTRSRPSRPAAAPPSRNPYPVVLGPVDVAPVTFTPVAVEDFDPFSEVDLRQLRRSRRAEIAARTAERVPEAASVDAPPAIARPVLDGDTPLLAAAEAMLAYAVALFDAQASRFLASRAPSDARRLLVAAHGLRLTADTFADVLPAQAAERLVAALRPLAADLDAALEAARLALVGRARPDLVRQATATLDIAADRLRVGREPWGARARRIVDRLAAQTAQGARRSDDAPLADDFVGDAGDAPSPTRLRHMLGSTVWSRFEAVRAIEDDLRAPTPAVASHVAVALSGLRFVLSLVEPSAGSAARDVSAALEGAERAVVAVRQRLADGEATAAAELAALWEEVTAPPFKKRIAALVARV